MGNDISSINILVGLKKMPGFSCEVQTKAIAEYLGMFKAEHMNKHGNAKITKQEYIRTSPIGYN